MSLAATLWQLRPAFLGPNPVTPSLPGDARRHVSPARNRTIDGLRAFAIIAVIGVHILGRFFPGGGLGVDLFFVISGYVITAGLKREYERSGTLSLKDFYWRRIRRLWPALWAMIGLVALVGPMLGQPAGREALLALASMMNWARAFGFVAPVNVLGHTWSLAVEEQFYLLWAPLLLVLLRHKRLAIPVLVGSIVAASMWRLHILSFHTAFADAYAYNALECRIGSMLLGCLIAFRPDFGPLRLRRLWVVPAAGLSALVLFGRMPFVPSLFYDVVALLSAWLIYAAIDPAPALRGIMGSAPIQWAGLRSYSLYLWQSPMLYFITPIHLPFSVRFVLILACTSAAAELSYRWLERGFRSPDPRPASGFASTTLS
ncbi:MAG: oatA [Alphaproteobacteria bacterium]|nr:oatA [Alphaproteobacteria bacterium]